MFTGKLLPMYYYVPKDLIEYEQMNPGSRRRMASPEGSTEGIFLWGQAIYIISQLLGEMNVFSLYTEIF